MRSLRRITFGFLFLFLAQPNLLKAQTAGPQAAASRIDEIEARRTARQAGLTPAEQEKLERALVRLQELTELVTASSSGLRFKFSSDAPGWDGLSLGSGFSLGGEYYRPDLASGEVTFRASAVGTIKKNYLLDTQVTFPRLNSGHLTADFLARHKAEKSIHFYGAGPDSDKGTRTNYSRETTEADVALRWKPVRHFGIGATAGLMWLNVGPGISPRLASSEQVFDAAQAPGIDQQTDYFRSGAYAFFDSRVNEAISPRGTQLRVSFDQYQDVDLKAYTFGLLQASAQQSFTFFNEKRLITLRAQTATSYTRGANVVPFYFLQNLGGPDDLRGFRLFRFSDRNRLAMNAEYRWEVATPLDMAIFADGGKVFPDAGRWNLDGIEGSAGIGLRFKTRTAVPLRVDFAFGREGMNLWLRFSDLF